MASSLPVAIVTGTNSGVGLALAVLLAKQFRVFAGMRGISASRRAKLDEAASEVRENIKVIDLDVNSDESVSSAIESVIKETGRVDILVNNAGYSVFGTVEMLSMSMMKEQMETNLFGPIRCMKAVLPVMRSQRSGKIINISSVGGVWGQPFNDIYCASKFALEGLAESQAALFRTFGVSVTNVQPGAIKSDFISNAKKPELTDVPSDYLPAIQSTMAAFASGSGLGQTPMEVAQVIVDKVVNVESPPVKVQTNPAIQRVFEMQIADTTGEAGVRAATSKYLQSLAS